MQLVTQVHSLTAVDLTASGENEEISEHLVLELSFGRLMLALTHDITALAKEWQIHESECECSVFQSYEWASAWHTAVSEIQAEADEEPVYIIGRNEKQEVQFIWPMSISSKGGFRFLTWNCTDHSNYSMGINRREFASSATAADLKLILKSISSKLKNVSAAVLINQPFQWGEIRNPFSTLPHHASPNNSYVGDLSGGLEQLMSENFSRKSRSNLKYKERKLIGSGNFYVGEARDQTETRSVMDCYYEQKAIQFSKMGIENCFANETVQSFYSLLTMFSRDPKNRFAAFELKVDDDILATLIGTYFRDRFYVMLLSVTDKEIKKWSPGLVLLYNSVMECCSLDCRYFDLGVGRGEHKNRWVNQEVKLFDILLPLSWKGYFITLPLWFKFTLKRFIKNNDFFWATAINIRKALAFTQSAESKN